MNENNQTTSLPKTPLPVPKDYASDRDVRWCPGCGDYSVLAMVQKVMAQVGLPREKIAFISGIGCSSRFTYYMNAFGFHTIHGRALTIASGVKCANPELSVWVATGDGDALSIGGNHFVHTLRRNIGMNILLFNNRIYGLTKGQASPTTLEGKITKTTPFGSIEHPVNPISLALGSEGTFIARTLDRDLKHMQEMLLRVYGHRGTSLLEIMQNCKIFNDGAFLEFTEKETKNENVIFIEHNKPLVFGNKKDKGIKLDGWKITVINIDDGKNSINDCLVYNEKSKELAFLISEFYDRQDLPMPVGVFLNIERPTYEDNMMRQIEYTKEKLGIGDVDELVKGNSTWVIK